MLYGKASLDSVIFQIFYCNNVSIDREARLLSENQMRFNLASALVKGELKTVLEAIQGGGGSS